MDTGPVLGIETCGRSTGLALIDSGRVIAELIEESVCSHNEVLMPLLDRLLRDAGVKPCGLAGIGVDIGPGMFTSLRVGVSTAKGLAIAHRIPIVGLSSLWGLARTASPSLDGVLAVIDARKRQVYAALYLNGQTQFQPLVVTPGELAPEVGKVLSDRTSLVAAGDGTYLCLRSFAANQIKLEPSGIAFPSPGVIAIAAAELITRGQVDDLASLQPLYLRRTDAELTREQKLSPQR
jgi:tRNA threonylcarbamoyladenosine biosynthesis protein TsaB